MAKQPKPADTRLAQRIPLRPIDAGDFAGWLDGVQASQLEGQDSDVPCGECNGCCRSFYFIHITPKDTEALAVIPQALLFAAPGLPPGHFVMGYNEQGHCPMLIDNRCSIYLDRPQTCRAYDCRIFTAADMQPGETDKAYVRERTEAWAFSYETKEDEAVRASIARAAQWLARERDNRHSYLPADFIPSNSTQLAVLAIELRHLFSADIEDSRLSGREHAEACVAAART